MTNQLRMRGFSRGLIKQAPKSRSLWPAAYVLAGEWAKEFGAFSTKTERTAAAAIFRRLLVGDEDINVRAYSAQQISRTIRAVSVAVDRAAKDAGYQFKLYGPATVTWCIKKVLAGEELGRRVKAEQERSMRILSGSVSETGASVGPSMRIL